MKGYADFSLFVSSYIRFAFFIDWRRKKDKNNTNPRIPTNPNAKPGDSSNYLMGNNKYTNGQ